MKNRPGGVYSRPSDSSFSLPRGWPGPLPVFIQLTFTSHTAFFGTFLGSKKVPSLLVPLVLFFRDCAAADFVVYYKLVCLAQARAAAITLGMISIGENRYAV